MKTKRFHWELRSGLQSSSNATSMTGKSLRPGRFENTDTGRTVHPLPDARRGHGYAALDNRH